MLTKCKPPIYQQTKNSSIQLDSTIAENKIITDLISPYKTELDAEMNEVLVISSEEFKKESGKSETKLGNLVADLSFEIANQLYQPADGDSIDFCLLNFGGLRTSLPKGPITRGKIFELMPFENELVVVTIRNNKFIDLMEYIQESGGQPISGDIIFEYKIINNITDANAYKRSGNKRKNKNQIKIVTSDYLANGGDHMSFFLNPIKIEPLNIKLRDAIIQYCISENKKGNQLVGKLDGRITIEEK